MAQVATLFSPYDFNPLGFDPFRKLLEAHIDFALLRTTHGPELLIAATDVGTGRPRLFRRRELTVESVLASACLPTIHHAVAIDGRAYWDGGFCANPDLVTLGRESPVGDTLIVRLSPLRTDSVPASAREISARINQITFNQPMLRDVELIEAGRFTSSLAPESKGKPDLELLTYLHGAGRSETEKWLARARAEIGRRATVDLGRHFLGERAAPEVGKAGRNAPPEVAA